MVGYNKYNTLIKTYMYFIILSQEDYKNLHAHAKIRKELELITEYLEFSVASKISISKKRETIQSSKYIPTNNTAIQFCELYREISPVFKYKSDPRSCEQILYTNS